MILSLVKKELRLQESNCAFAAAIAVVWLFLFALSLQSGKVLIPRELTMGQLVQALHYFFVLPCLFIIFPLMLGASTAAPERKLGVFDWQLSLPVPRVTQWAVKAAIALALSLTLGGVLAWLLDWVLAKALAAHGAEWVLESSKTPEPLLLRGVWPGLYVVLFVAFGAYASSVTSDPYRALVAGVALLALTFAMHSVVDPHGMLLPFTLRKSFPEYFIHPWWRGAHVWFLSMALVALAFSNFRLDGLRWWSVAWHTGAWTAVIVISAWRGFHAEFDIRQPLDPSLKQLAASHPGLTPLLGSPNAPDAAQRITVQSALLRISHPDRIVTSAFSGEDDGRIRASSDRWYDWGRWGWWGRAIEIDMDTGAIQQIPNAAGSVSYVAPDGSFYGDYHRYAVFTKRIMGFPVVIARQTIQERLACLVCPSLSGRFASVRDLSGADDPAIKTVNGRKITGHEIVRPILIKPDASFYLMAHYSKDAPGEYEANLIRKQQGEGSPPRYDLIDKQSISGYAISPDGRWYARIWRGFHPVEIAAVDHGTTHIIQNEGGAIRLTREGWKLPDENELGIPGPLMTVSPNGRFLAFVRIRNRPLDHEVETLLQRTGRTAGTEEFGVPETIEMALLDLQTGEEGLLARLTPNPRVVKAYEAWVRLRASLGKRAVHGFDFELTRTYERMLPTLWSPGGSLVWLHGGDLHLFEISPDSGDLKRERKIDVRITDASDMDFWNADTMILWNQYSIWRLEVGKALRESGNTAK